MTHRAFTVYKPDGVTITLPTEASLQSWQGRGLIEDADLVVDLHGRWVRGGTAPTRSPFTRHPHSTPQAQQTQTNLLVPVQRERPVPVWLAAAATLIVAFAAAAAIAELQHPRHDEIAQLDDAGQRSARPSGSAHGPTRVVTLAMAEPPGPAPASSASVMDTDAIAAATRTPPGGLGATTRPNAQDTGKQRGGGQAEADVEGAVESARGGADGAASGVKLSGSERRAAAREARTRLRAERRAARQVLRDQRAAAMDAAAAEREREAGARTVNQGAAGRDTLSHASGHSVSTPQTVRDVDSFEGMLAEARRLDRQHPERAADVYALALSRRPGDPTAMVGQARSLQRSGQAFEALAAYRACAQRLPRYSPCQAGLGKLLERFGDHSGAREAYATYLAATPDGSEARAIRERLEGLSP